MDMYYDIRPSTAFSGSIFHEEFKNHIDKSKNLIDKNIK
jgi:hypothetical protein